MADGLTGSSAGWAQTNYYSSAYADQTGITKETLPEDLKYLFDMGSTFYPTFNDVAIASSYVNGSNTVSPLQMTAGEFLNVNHTLSLPTYAKLKNAMQRDQLYVVAILLDQSGKVLNAAKAHVTDASSVAGVHNSNAIEAVRYTLDGRQISAPQHGINIVRMSDGTVRKVMVK